MIFITVLRISTPKVTKIPGTIGWFIRSLCEQTLRARLTLREESQVELWEWPNELSASGILPPTDNQSQSCFSTHPVKSCFEFNEFECHFGATLGEWNFLVLRSISISYSRQPGLQGCIANQLKVN